MTTALFFALLIIGYFVYQNLLGRIKSLEKEVFDLKQLSNDKTPERKSQTELSNEEKETFSGVRFENVSPSPKIITEKIPKEKPEWQEQLTHFLKQNALSILGIITLVLGIGYFVKYAIDKDWVGETSRVLIGIFAGLGIAGTGFFLRKNYKIFSYILTGGGIAILYFTVTMAFREYHLFSQTLAFAMLVLITILAVALAYFYDSESLIMISMIGGFSAPLMISTGQSNYPFLFGYLSLLNFGLLAVIALKNWKNLGWLNFVLTSAYFFYWIISETQIASVLYFYLYYFTFSAVALLDYFRRKKLERFDILMLVLVNLTTLGGLLYVFKTLGYGPIILIPVSLALVNFLLLIRELKAKNSGIGYSVFAGLVISLLTFSVAVYFDSFLITSLWAVETSLLFFLWLKTGQLIFKRFFTFLFVLLIAAQMISWNHYFEDLGLKMILNKVFLTGLLVAFSVLFNLFLIRYFKRADFRESHPDTFGLLNFSAFALFYFTFFLELYYHIQNFGSSKVTVILLIYSIYYLTFVVLIQDFFKLNSKFRRQLINLTLILFAAISLYSAVVSSVLILGRSLSFYIFYLLYLIPLAIIFTKLKNQNLNDQAKKIGFPIFILTVVICCEISNLYLFSSVAKFEDLPYLRERFVIFYLPIIWTVFAAAMIYFGIRKNMAELTKCGFVLIGLMIVKLYTYDVWKMDNISRIVAFILLGLILLISSFTFQKLTKMLKDLIDKEEKE